nr:MAG TPA: hypothetical protein [Caudoviricetes sp.]
MLSIVGYYACTTSNPPECGFFYFQQGFSSMRLLCCVF